MSISDNPRIFNPAQQIRANPSKTITRTSDILHHDSEQGVRQLVMYALFAPETPRVVQNSLVVAISSRSKGPKVGYGVYFAPESPLNENGLLLDSSVGDSLELAEKGEFCALSKALGIVEERFGKTSRVVIITESKPLVQGLAEDVWQWEFNGFKDSNGKDVLDADVFRELHARISRLEQGAGMDVSFWCVEREWNLEAGELASAAFDS